MHGLDCFVCELWILRTRSRKLGSLANGLRGRKKEPTHFIWVKIQVNYYFFLFFYFFFPSKFHGFQLYFVSKLLNSLAYEVEDENNDYLDNVLLRSREMDPTISINELRWDFFLSFSPNKEINPKKKKKKKSFYFVCDKYLSAHFRIFVGTWNVAGRSPVGSLAVDLDEWLNLKDAADMYVLG